MAKIQVDLHQVSGYIFGVLRDEGFTEKIDALKREFDFNPFNQDDDAYVGPWDEIRHNGALLGDVVTAAIHVAERITIDGISLNDAQKHAAVVQALDDMIRLPWYAEPFDGTVFNMAVTAGVRAMNAVGWIREIMGGGSTSTRVNATADKLEVGTTVKAISVTSVQAARERRRQLTK